MFFVLRVLVRGLIVRERERREAVLPQLLGEQHDLLGCPRAEQRRSATREVDRVGPGDPGPLAYLVGVR